jgi:quinoprotein relay system zinc metallohydrolase 2
MAMARPARSLVLLCLLPIATPAAPAPDEAATVTKIAPGAYVRAGHSAVVFEADDVANIGFIVGERCVAVIDSGGSEEEGLALQRAIARVTTLPVCYVIDTHAHPDHVFGNRVFAQAGARIVGHAKLARALAARAQTYLERAAAANGRPIAPETIVVPELVVSDTLELDLGARLLRLTAHGAAHTDNDLSILDVETQTLWLGDLVFEDHVPVLDGSLNGWIAELEALRKVPAARAVPGHGPASIAWPAGADDTLRYLTALRDDLRRRIAAGDDMRDAQENAVSEEAARWQLFDRYHARNVAAAFAELEWE